MMRLLVLALWLVRPLLALAQAPGAPPPVTAPVIETADFTARAAQYAARAGATVAVLASDSLAGRGYGPADGARRAARYLAQRFASLHLEPVGDSAGRSYYQHFSLAINTFPAELTLQLNGRALRPGLDFIAAPDCPSTRLQGALVVLDSTWFERDSAELLALIRLWPVRGAILVLTADDEDVLPSLPRAVRAWVASAAAVLVREPEKLTASLARAQAAQPWLRLLEAAWRRTESPRTATLAVDARLEPAYPALNVIGRVRGLARTDSAFVVTAHYDHLGRQGQTATFFGANDNASGTAMLLELAAAIARAPLPHDVLFIAFSAEEAGLVGSRWCAANPPIPLPQISFLLNLDLEGFGDGATVVNATLWPRQFELLQRLNITADPDRQPLLPTLKARGRAANSDHYPFSERGVPAFFVYSHGGPGHYHDVRDRPETLRLAEAYRVYALMHHFLRALSRKP